MNPQDEQVVALLRKAIRHLQQGDLTVDEVRTEVAAVETGKLDRYGLPKQESHLRALSLVLVVPAKPTGLSRD